MTPPVVGHQCELVGEHVTDALELTRVTERAVDEEECRARCVIAC